VKVPIDGRQPFARRARQRGSRPRRFVPVRAQHGRLPCFLDGRQTTADRVTEDVRRAAIDAVDRQMSPLVQIALIDFLVKANERESAPMLRRLAQNPQVHTAVRSRAAWGLQQLG